MHEKLYHPLSYKGDLGIIMIYSRGARGIMVIVVRNGHSDMSSNPAQD